MNQVRGAIFLFASFLIILIYVHIHFHLSYAQWIMQPLPLPSPEKPDCCNKKMENETSPPKIIITTDTLYEGNNVLKLKIEDKYPLKLREIKYTKNNKNIVTYLAKEHNNEYIALVKVVSPFTEVQVKAVDVNDNFAQTVKKIKVINWFDLVVSSIVGNPFWKNIISFIWR